MSLAGKRVLIGRTPKQARSLTHLLRGKGAVPIAIPFIQIRPPRSYGKLDAALRLLASYDWLILTSVNGADILFERSRRLRVKIPATLAIAAIGPATRTAIEARGVRVAVTPRQYV